MKRYFIVFCLALILSACGSRAHTFNLEKEGVAYNYGEQVFFYHPRDWEVSVDTIKLSLDIVNPDAKEGLYFDTFEINSSNSKEELLNFYLTKLKNLGIEVQKSKKTQLEGAQRCTLIEGYSVSDSIYFKEVVVFIDGKQYVYSYIADKDVYEKNVDNMTAYLMTLVVNDSQKAV